MNRNLLFLLSLCFFLIQCTQPAQEEQAKLSKEINKVVIREAADANSLNPITASGELSNYLQQLLFQPLMEMDFQSLALTPILVERRADINITEDGKMLLSYRLRPEAKWDNGQNISVDDVIFSLKLIKHPEISPGYRSYCEFIEDIQKDPNDPLAFTIVCSSVYILSEYVSASMMIMPAYQYDPEGVMQAFSIQDLHIADSNLMRNQALKDFATRFKSDEFQRNLAAVSGSGAYRVVSWKSGQQIKLQRKTDWWADALTEKNAFLAAYPDELVFEIIKDNTTATIALRNQQIDVMRNINPKDYQGLTSNEKVNANYVLHQPEKLAYAYVGINLRKDALQDQAVRKALALLCPVEQMMNTVYYGYAKRTIGPIPLGMKQQYNDSITAYPFDPTQAAQILAENGWADQDDDGILDKEINGKLIPLQLELIFTNSKESRKLMAILMQEEARKLGIAIELRDMDLSVYLKRLRSHDFDLYLGSTVMPPIPRDHKSRFHSTNALNGRNFSGFSNPQADALIDSIRTTLDEAKRAQLNHQFQELLHEEIPFIFLFAEQELMAIHRRFDNAKASSARPGFWVPAFRLKESL